MIKRIALNVAALAVVFGGSVSLSASVEPIAPGGGSCCDQASTTCYLNLGDNIIVQQSGARAC